MLNETGRLKRKEEIGIRSWWHQSVQKKTVCHSNRAGCIAGFTVHRFISFFSFQFGLVSNWNKSIFLRKISSEKKFQENVLETLTYCVSKTTHFPLTLQLLNGTGIHGAAPWEGEVCGWT